MRQCPNQLVKRKRVFNRLIIVFVASTFYYIYFSDSNYQFYTQTLCSERNNSNRHLTDQICNFKIITVKFKPQNELEILLDKNKPRNGLSIYVDINDSSKEYHDHCSTCAVVSSAGILENSSAGKDIDSHECVFRMNHHAGKNYEKDVGRRTTHR